MIAHWFRSRKWALCTTLGVALGLLLGDGAPAVASMPFLPLFEFTAISSSAPGANADITFRTTVPAGHHILGDYNLTTPDDWSIAGHSGQLNGKVAAIGTLTINLDPDGNCKDGDSGSPQTYGPFPLLDQVSEFDATWSGLITDFGDGNPGTNWTLAFDIVSLNPGYAIAGFLTTAIPPAGNAVCTPQVFTLTTCGRANPTATATTCGTGSDPVVMTNPAAAGCHVWPFNSLDDSGYHRANRQAGVPIGGTPCDADADGVTDPGDNCPLWPNPAQVLPPWPIPPGDPDCDGFSSAVEDSAGTFWTLHCGFNAWPPDITNNSFTDTGDVGALTANFGLSVPPAPARHNIAPVPNSFIDTGDIGTMTAFFGKTCS